LNLVKLGKSGLLVPAVAVGCMRIGKMSEKELSSFVDTCLENGANFFDHADIYSKGESEVVFGKAVKGKRDKLILQSKCGIVPGKAFDFSYEHIVKSVDGSLKRLGTDYLDVLLLHRPDALMEPEEVARAFRDLKKEGKVRHFGVSNQNPYQMRLLEKYLDEPLVANQLQFSIMHSSMIQSGINVNMYNDSATGRDGGVLDYCRLNDITIQAWSPMQYGFFKGSFVDNDKFPELNRVLGEIGEKYSVTKSTVAYAWILRHPAKMQVVTGTTKEERLLEAFSACDVKLTREEWYAIYKSAGNVLP